MTTLLFAEEWAIWSDGGLFFNFGSSWLKPPCWQDYVFWLENISTRLSWKLGRIKTKKVFAMKLRSKFGWQIFVLLQKQKRQGNGPWGSLFLEPHVVLGRVSQQGHSKFWRQLMTTRRWDSNPRRLGGKRERFLWAVSFSSCHYFPFIFSSARPSILFRICSVFYVRKLWSRMSQLSTGQMFHQFSYHLMTIGETRVDQYWSKVCGVIFEISR